MIYKLDSSHRNFLNKLALSQYKKTRFPKFYKAWRLSSRTATMLSKLKSRVKMSHYARLKSYALNQLQHACNYIKQKQALAIQSVQHFEKVRQINSFSCWKLYALDHKRRVKARASSFEYIAMLRRCAYSKILMNNLRSNKIYATIRNKCVRSHINKLIIKSLTGLLENCVNRKKRKEVTQRAKHFKLSLMKSIGLKKFKHVALCRNYAKKLRTYCSNFFTCNLKIKVFSAFKK